MKFPLPLFAPPDPAPGATPVAEKPDLAPAPAPTPAPAAAAKPAPVTALTADPTPAPVPAAKPGDKPAVESVFPEDWREQMAGGNKDAAKLLNRYKTPGDIAKALVESRSAIAKGLRGTPMPDAAADAEGAKAWREERGIPAEPTAYVQPDALKGTITDADKPIIAAFAEAAHTNNWSQKQFDEGLQIYFKFQQDSLDQRAEADRAASEAVQTELRQEFGGDFSRNIKIAKQVATEVVPGLNWFDARLPDGRLLGNVKEFVVALADAGSKMWGELTVVGGEQVNVDQSRETFLLDKMRNNIDDWNAHPEWSKELDEIRSKPNYRPKAA